MPSDTLEASPNGLPIASTQSPTLIASESPSFNDGSPSTLPFSFTTATSVRGSRPRICPSKDRPSSNRTRMATAPSTTWLLVRTIPFESTMNPEPVPWRMGP